MCPICFFLPKSIKFWTVNAQIPLLVSSSFNLSTTSQYFSIRNNKNVNLGLLQDQQSRTRLSDSLYDAFSKLRLRLQVRMVSSQSILAIWVLTEKIEKSSKLPIANVYYRQTKNFMVHNYKEIKLHQVLFLLHEYLLQEI